MAIEDRLEIALKEAFAAIRHAQDTRRYHARNTPKGHQQREEDLKAARERLRLAMDPLRSWRGGSHYRPHTARYVDLESRIILASDGIQKERRRLWKMQHPDWREESKRPKKVVKRGRPRKQADEAV